MQTSAIIGIAAVLASALSCILSRPLNYLWDLSLPAKAEDPERATRLQELEQRFYETKGELETRIATLERQLANSQRPIAPPTGTCSRTRGGDIDDEPPPPSGVGVTPKEETDRQSSNTPISLPNSVKAIDTSKGDHWPTEYSISAKAPADEQLKGDFLEEEDERTTRSNFFRDS
ncbi:MAG: hypothetical protein Q9163_002832 [Psora crenata]